MAVGDIVSGIANIAGIASLDYQPAVGIEAVIYGAGGTIFLGVAPNQRLDVAIGLFNGVGRSDFYSNLAEPHFLADLRLEINNTNYLRVINSNAGAQILSYYGLQTK